MVCDIMGKLGKSSSSRALHFARSAVVAPVLLLVMVLFLAWWVFQTMQAIAFGIAILFVILLFEAYRIFVKNSENPGRWYWALLSFTPLAGGVAATLIAPLPQETWLALGAFCVLTLIGTFLRREKPSSTSP